VPAQYQTSTEQVVLRQAGEEIRKIPGRFETVQERVLVQEASFELVTVGSGTGTTVIPGRAGVTITLNGTNYNINTSTRVVTDSNGRRVGTVDNSGNIVATNGSMMASGAVNPLTMIATSGQSTLRIGSTSYRVDASGTVYNMSGRRVGSIGSGGNIVGSNGNVLSRSAVNHYGGSTGSRSGAPTFRTVTETVVVQEASTELVVIPPVYETVTETVVVQPQTVEYAC